MKTLKDERYVVISMAYTCTVSEIWRNYYVSVVSLHIESTDSMILVFPRMKSGTGYTRTRVDNILPKMLNSLHVRGQKNLDNNNGHALEFLAPV